MQPRYGGRRYHHPMVIGGYGKNTGKAGSGYARPLQKESSIKPFISDSTFSISLRGI
jgi:hypothetical protein